jgi:hypothetical protein
MPTLMSLSSCYTPSKYKLCSQPPIITKNNNNNNNNNNTYHMNEAFAFINW